MSDRRQRIGKRGEELARRYLASLDYAILETNYRAAGGEIDLVAEHRGTLVFVEVRTRGVSDFGSPEESVTRAKRSHMVAAAQEYLQIHHAEERDWRVDLVAIEYGRDGTVTRVEIVENAVEV